MSFFVWYTTFKEGVFMDKQRLDKQFAFIKEIDKDKLIKRQTLLTDKVTLENDAEHAWHMAIMTLLLSEYANEKIDVLKTISMLLIHDLVEIKAGDTYCYDEVNKETQRQRELEAADYIFSMLPKDQGEKFRALWDEFEEEDTPEARFARAMDRVQPVMLNDASDGKKWVEHEVCLSQVMKRNAPVEKGSKVLWEYVLNEFISPNVEKGRLKNQ